MFENWPALFGDPNPSVVRTMMIVGWLCFCAATSWAGPVVWVPPLVLPTASDSTPAARV